jgi:anti-sigma factor RsiW
MWLTRRMRSRKHRLACADVVELVTDYLDGALAPEVADQVRTHIAECEGCDVYVQQIAQTAAALRGVELAGLSDEACAELVEAFRSWRRPPAD